MNRRTRRMASAVGAIFFGCVAAHGVEAQQTFRACYVPQVGAMYLLDLPGLPNECLSTEHEEISWIEGNGPPEPVTTADIDDGAVASPKLADGAVTATKLAEGAVTATKLADGAVTGAGIADDAVQSHHVAMGAIRGDRLGLGLVQVLDDVVVTAGGGLSSSLTCPLGLEVITGGWFTAYTEVRVTGSAPAPLSDDPGEWVFIVRNDGATPAGVSLFAVCADLAG